MSAPLLERATLARDRLLPSGTVGGVGGLLFVIVVVAQNVLRAAAPQPDASAAKVVDYYAAHQATTAVLAVLFVLSGIGLVCFVAGMLDRLVSGPARGPAIIGALGAAGILCLFSTMLATDLTLSRLVDTGVRQREVVLAVWTAHEAAFAVLLLAIGVALAGFSAAATGDGLVGSAWRPVGALGAVALGATAAAAPAMLGGAAVLYLGLAGFVVWLAFIVRASVALLSRARSMSSASASC